MNERTLSSAEGGRRPPPELGELVGLMVLLQKL